MLISNGNASQTSPFDPLIQMARDAKEIVARAVHFTVDNALDSPALMAWHVRHEATSALNELYLQSASLPVFHDVVHGTADPAPRALLSAADALASKAVEDSLQPPELSASHAFPKLHQSVAGDMEKLPADASPFERLGPLAGQGLDIAVVGATLVGLRPAAQWLRASGRLVAQELVGSRVVALSGTRGAVLGDGVQLNFMSGRKPPSAPGSLGRGSPPEIKLTTNWFWNQKLQQLQNKWHTRDADLARMSNATQAERGPIEAALRDIRRQINDLQHAVDNPIPAGARRARLSPTQKLVARINEIREEHAALQREPTGARPEALKRLGEKLSKAERQLDGTETPKHRIDTRGYIQQRGPGNTKLLTGIEERIAKFRGQQTGLDPNSDNYQRLEELIRNDTTRLQALKQKA